MTREEKNKVHERIKRHLRRTREDIEELTELCKPIPPDNSYGRVSRMDAINNKSVNEATLIQAKNRLLDLNTALENIDKGDFGQCIKCGTEIQVGRLLVRPESNTCIKCANKG